MKKIAIKKGINLYLIRDSKFKEFRACVLFHRPLAKCEVTLNSLMTSVMRMQSENFENSTAISTALEELYGAELIARAGKYGERQILKLGIQSVNTDCENFKSALELLFDIAFHAGGGSGFSEDITANEKKNIADAILSQKNDKRSYSVLRLQEEMCKDEPYGINPVGYSSELDKITASSLYKHYMKVIAESKIDIIFTGNFDEDEALSLTKYHTENLNEREGIFHSEIIKKAGKVRKITDKMDVTQGKLCIGFRSAEKTSSENYPAVIVYNTVFGGSATSKLFNNVREKLSLCYYVNSSIDRLKEIMIVKSGVEFENLGKAYEEIMLQQQAMCRGEITEEEIDAAKKQLINAYSSNFDSVSAMAEYYTMQLLLGTDVSIEEMIEKVKNVTKEEIVSAANGMTEDTVYFLEKSGEAAQ